MTATITTAQAPRPGTGPRRSRTETVCLTGVVSSVVSFVLVLGAPWHWLALVGALLLACVPAGASIMCRLDTGNDAAQAGLTLALSLAVFSIASSLMIWFSVWQPRALLVIPVLSLISCRRTQLRTPHRGAAASVRGSPWFLSGGPSLWLLPLGLLPIGVGAWVVGVSRLTRAGIGAYGLLAAANPWFVAGLTLLLAGATLELRRFWPRSWLLGLYLIAILVAIHATVPILYGTPEYAWVYKHIGIVESFGLHGRLTDPSNIYNQWPLLFAAGAALSALGHTGPLMWTTWAPLAFELAEALVVLGIFRLLVSDRRVAFLGVLLYVGLVSWVGQDYFSPQAFGYLLWLAIVLVTIRWLRAPPRRRPPTSRLDRWVTAFHAGMRPAPETTPAIRRIAVGLVAILYFAIVAAHQLTPYLALAAMIPLAALDLVRPRWLPLLLAAIAIAYLIPRYDLIARDFGGLFSGSNPITNASGSPGTHHPGPEELTAWIVRGLAATMWVGAIAVVARARAALGRVALPIVLAFSPFVILFAQRYGGEAIYRIYLFSAPWCALLIAGWLVELRVPRRRWLVSFGACGVALFAGLQGLYGPVLSRAVTPAELAASRWLYANIPRGSLIVLPVDDFPVLETADYNAYPLQVMPSDPQLGESWLDESNLGDIESWIADLGYGSAYVPFSRAMSAYAAFFGAPEAYDRLAAKVRTAPGWSVVFRNEDVTIYRLNLARAALTTAPAAAAPTPATIIRALARAPSRTAHQSPRGIVRKR